MVLDKYIITYFLCIQENWIINKDNQEPVWNVTVIQMTGNDVVFFLSFF